VVLAANDKAQFRAAADLYFQKNYEDALAIFLRFADEGNVEAQNIVAKMYEWGEGTPRDKTMARKWFERAARNHDVDSMNGLAIVMSDQGDYAGAFDWFRRAARAGSTTARYRLGVMHDGGLGTERSIPRAVAQYKAASTEGHLLARSRLGILALAGAVDDLSRLRGFFLYLSTLPSRAFLRLFDSRNPRIEP
jgi:hypothetical protein